jgi:hypothetical protein
MAATKYFQSIIDTLEGTTEELRPITRERLDWSGTGALLELYRKTSGNERSLMIAAIGQVIEQHPCSAAVLAELIGIASALDVAQVEPQVRKLQSEPIASDEQLQRAITNYLAFRKVALPARGITLVTRGVNG